MKKKFTFLWSILFMLSFFWNSQAYAAADWCIRDGHFPCGYRNREDALANGKCTRNSLSNRGGYVANTARVERNIFGFNRVEIGINAQICDMAQVSGYARVLENAQVSGTAQVSEDAQVFGNAQVSGNTQVFGTARVFENAQVSGNAWVYGNARVYEDARVFENAWVTGNARVSGNAQLSGNAKVTGYAWVFGNAQLSGNAEVSGDARVSRNAPPHSDNEPQIVNTTEDKFLWPLHHLIENHSHEELLNEELNSQDTSLVSIRSSDQKSLLELAIDKEFFKTLKLLLSKGANPFLKKDNGNDPSKTIFISELRGNRTHLLKIMVQNNPKVMEEVLRHLTTNLKMPEYANIMDLVLPIILEMENSSNLLQLLNRENRKANLKFSQRVEKKIHIYKNENTYGDHIESVVTKAIREIQEDSYSCSASSRQTQPGPGLGHLMKEIDKIQSVTCPLCLVSFSGHEKGFQYENCHCQSSGICSKNCLEVLLAKGLAGDAGFPAKCPGLASECHGTLEKEDLERFQKMGIPLSDKAILKYRILNAHQKVRSMGLQNKVKTCRSPDCFNLVNIKNLPADHHFDCPLCGDDLCVDCGHQHYEEKDCESAAKNRKGEESFEKLIHDPKSNLRPCPHCLAPTEKSEACDHMTCKHCNKKWDWRLGKIGNAPIHYSRNDGSEPRTYRVPGDKNSRNGTTYTEYEENVR